MALSLGAAAVASALTALLVVGLQTVQTASRTAVEQSAGWLLAGAAGIGTLSGLARWLGRGWASAPEVQRANRALGGFLLAAVGTFGGWALAVRALGVLEGDATTPLGWPLVARALVPLAAGLAAGWLAHRR